jgi:dsRNA-specific ribonuclease
MPLNNNLRNNGESRLYSTKNTNNPRINEIIGTISNTKNFNIAFTHKSCINDDPTLISYERLEYLGDSILEQHISIFLYYSFPEYSEGELTTVRTNLVQGSYLFSISLKIGLNNYLKLGESLKSIDFNSKSLSKKRSKILVDIFESFIAVLYIEKDSKTLFEFLFLTVLDKPEFKNKFNNFNSNVIPLLYPTNNKMLHTPESQIKENIKITSKNIVPTTNISNPINSVITDNEIKAKLSLFIDKSLKNHEDILEILVKIYVLMEYNSNKGQ